MVLFYIFLSPSVNREVILTTGGKCDLIHRVLANRTTRTK